MYNKHRGPCKADSIVFCLRALWTHYNRRDFRHAVPEFGKGALYLMRRGGAFRIVGLILGIVGTVISVTALVFSIVGMLLGKKPVKPNIR